MSRLRLLAVMSSAVLLVCALPGWAADPLPQPSAGCQSFTDASGDANKQLDFGVGVNPVPSDPDVDLTRVTFASPPGKIRVYLQVVALGGPEYGIGHIFNASFVLKGKPVRIFGGQDDPSALDAAHALPLTAPLSGVTYDNAKLESAPEVVFDLAHNTVVLTADRAPIEKAAATSLTDGAVLTSIAAETHYDLLASAQVVDVAAPLTPATATYTLGDNSCFDAPPAPTATPSAPTPTPTATATPTPTPSPTPTPTPPTAPGTLFEVPRANCVTYSDAAGDADPTGPLKGAPGIATEAQEPSLDVTQVNLRSPQGAVEVFVKVADVDGALAPWFSGRQYDVAFTLGAHRVTLTGTGAGAGAATVGPAANADIKTTVRLDTKDNFVIFAVALDGLGKAVGMPVAAGAALTDLTVTTTATGPSTQKADDAAGTKPEERSYSYGDNTCFTPPPGKLNVDADTKGQFGDVTDVFATLTDEADEPVPGATLMARLGSVTRSAVTDADGIADFALPITALAGARPIAVTFAGTAVVGAVAVSVPFTVVVERVLLKATGVRGGATGKVLDDDGRPVVGQPVTFTVGSKKTVVKTNAKGVAVLGRVAKGVAIKVSFAAVPGKYAATPSYTVKAL